MSVACVIFLYKNSYTNASFSFLHCLRSWSGTVCTSAYRGEWEWNWRKYTHTMFVICWCSCPYWWQGRKLVYFLRVMFISFPVLKNQSVSEKWQRSLYFVQLTNSLKPGVFWYFSFNILTIQLLPDCNFNHVHSTKKWIQIGFPHQHLATMIANYM